MITVMSMMRNPPAEVRGPEHCMRSLDVKLGLYVSRMNTETYETNDIAYNFGIRECSVPTLFVKQDERSSRGGWMGVRYSLRGRLPRFQ